MLPNERPSVQTPCATLRLTASTHAARSRLRRVPRPRHLLPLIARPACHAPDPCRFDSRIARPDRRGHPSPCPHPTCIVSALPHLSLSISRPLTAKRLPSLFPNPTPLGCLARSCPLPMPAGHTSRGTSGHPQPSQGHPRACPDASGARAPLLAAGSHLDGRNRPA